MFGSKCPIGVDIGSHTIKVCQLRRMGEIFELQKLGVAEIYDSGERPSDPKEQQAAKVAALKRALESAQIKTRQCVSAICGESIIVRYLQLPEMPEGELKKALQWEAEEYIPFRLSEVNIDSMILGHSNDGEHAKMDVLLVSAKKDLVESHVSILREANLDPRVVEVDSFSFLNCFEINHSPAPEECVALINIGGEITSLNVYTAGVSRFSRDISIGGETITQAIKARLGCSLKEAERLKISHGAPSVQAGSADGGQGFAVGLMSSIMGRVDEMAGAGGSENAPEAVANKAIQTVLSNLFSEIRRSIEFFENQYRGYSVSRLVLGGGTSSMTNLLENFEKEFGLPVERIDPLRRVRVPDKFAELPIVQSMRYQLGVGIGLGLRGLAA